MAIRSPFHITILYPVQKEVRIATPVCALARNDILYLLHERTTFLSTSCRGAQRMYVNHPGA